MENQPTNSTQPSHADQPDAEGVGESSRSFFAEWRGFFIFVALMLIFRSVVADWNHVPSGSMRPTLLVGDRVVVNKLAFDLRVPFTFVKLWQHSDPQRGDIITFESPKDGKLLIKRVVGVPGDRVALDNNNLSVNGIASSYTSLTESQIESLQMPDASDFDALVETVLGHSRYTLRERSLRNSSHGSSSSYTYTYSTFRAIDVPEKSYLVLGDNRDNSGDFRDPNVSFVPRSAILGRAHSVAFSLDYENSYLPRGGRFAQSLALDL